MAVETQVEVTEPLFARIGRGIVGFFETLSGTHALVREIDLLNSMTDNELSKRGLTREAAIRSAVRRYCYL